MEFSVPCITFIEMTTIQGESSQVENLINMMAGRDQPMDYDLSFDNPRKSYQYKSWGMTVVRSRPEVNERSKSNGISPFSIRRYQVIISCI